MRIFELEQPVLDKIKTLVDPYLAALTKPQPVLYFTFEPDEDYIRDQMEEFVASLGKKVLAGGVICVYTHELKFPKGQGSNDETQNSNSSLVVDAYGFGDQIEGDDIQSVFEAQFRAQTLTTLIYKAIIDRQEIEGSDGVEQNFGVSFDILDKFPISIQKFPPLGSMDTKRGIVAYRSIYEFLLTEDVPTEPLGLPFAGSDDITSDTYNPGNEPDE